MRMSSESLESLVEAIKNAGGNILSHRTNGNGLPQIVVEPNIFVNWFPEAQTVTVQGKDSSAFREALKTSLDMGRTRGPAMGQGTPDTGNFPKKVEGTFRRFVRSLSMKESGTIVAACDDGSVWILTGFGLHEAWKRLPDIPQPGEEGDK